MKHLKKITNRVLLNNYAMLMDKPWYTESVWQRLFLLTYFTIQLIGLKSVNLRFLFEWSCTLWWKWHALCCRFYWVSVFAIIIFWLCAIFLGESAIIFHPFVKQEMIFTGTSNCSSNFKKKMNAFTLGNNIHSIIVV